MTLLDVALSLLLTPPLIFLVRRLFRFLDESAQYQVELKQLRSLGLAEVTAGRSSVGSGGCTSVHTR
jgi:hypothetical protein